MIRSLVVYPYLSSSGFCGEHGGRYLRFELDVPPQIELVSGESEVL